MSGHRHFFSTSHPSSDSLMMTLLDAQLMSNAPSHNTIARWEWLFDMTGSLNIWIVTEKTKPGTKVSVVQFFEIYTIDNSLGSSTYASE